MAAQTALKKIDEGIDKSKIIYIRAARILDAFRFDGFDVGAACSIFDVECRQISDVLPSKAAAIFAAHIFTSKSDLFLIFIL
ncbi:MAG: hypothetical protein ACR2F2_10715 [Pyrinomonadaceae bacterium]